MNHYYTNDPDLAHDEHSFDFELGGHSLRFTSDNGVFSKHTVDFGSRVLIATILAEELPAGPILDVGTGYGPIGLALAKHFPDRQVTMSDVNERALALAQRNATDNAISNVTIVESSMYDQIDGQFGVIVTNPPIRAGKTIVSGILAGAAEHCCRMSVICGDSKETRCAICIETDENNLSRCQHCKKGTRVLYS